MTRRFEVPLGLDLKPLRPVPTLTIGGEGVASRFEPRRSKTYIWKTAKLGKVFPFCGGAATGRTIAPLFGYFTLTAAALCLRDRRWRRGAVHLVNGNG